MIYDKIDNLNKYESLHSLFGLVADYIGKVTAPGRYEIKGEQLFATVSEYTTQKRADRIFESHREYIDIQIIDEGCEETDIAYGTSGSGYDLQNDIEFADVTNDYSTLILKKGYFVVFFPNEWHRPCITHGRSAQKVAKTVFKIKARGEFDE